MTDIPGRSSSGVRLAGDEYQHLVTLNEALSAIRSSATGTLTVEASGAGNVDDLVVMLDQAPTRYTQMKHAVDAQSPVGSDWLLTPSRKGGRSLLQRFHSSWHLLGGRAARPHLQLVTDRDVDPSDRIMSLLDRRSSLVMPAGRAASLTKERVVWSAHLEIEDDELCELLEDLHFVTGRSFAIEWERAALHLDVLGLNSDQRALDSGIAMVRDWVKERERTLTVEELARLVEDRVGTRQPPGAQFVVEGIDDSPFAADADASVRFVDLYEGADPFDRRKLADGKNWQAVVLPELLSAADDLLADRKRRVIVGGPMRLAMWFGAGGALRHVRGFTLSVHQGDQVWSSDHTGPQPQVTVESRDVGPGTDLAVAVAASADPTPEALEFLAGNVRVGRLITISPSTGIGNASVPDGQSASALSEAIRDATRDALAGSTERIHLFLAVPGGLALLMGHRWNALRPTLVYEHLGVGRGYEPTFVLPA